MSRSLSRIRNLISEIEEIQRQGQQSAKESPDRKLSAPKLSSVPISVAEEETQNVSMLPTPSATVSAQAPHSKIETDPFEEIAELVRLDTERTEVREPAPVPGKVSVQLSGSVALSLQIEHSNETVELKQVGESIEIRFADGKAFHIPFKAMA